MTLSYPQKSAAEAFTSAEFLTWKTEAQSFYFSVSIGMAGLVIAENNAPQARCVERWYFDDVENAEDYMRDAMKRFPEFHPRGVIAASLEKQCGPIKLD